MENIHEPAIKELEAKLAEIESQANGLKASIKALQSLSNNPAEHPVSTQKSVGFFGFSPVNKTGKVAMVLKAIHTLNRFVRIQEIVESTSLEASKVRSAVSMLLSDGQITKIQVTTSNNDTFWGLPDWKDNDKIKSEHMFDKSKIQGHKFLIQQ